MKLEVLIMGEKSPKKEVKKPKAERIDAVSGTSTKKKAKKPKKTY